MKTLRVLLLCVALALTAVLSACDVDEDSFQQTSSGALKFTSKPAHKATELVTYIYNIKIGGDNATLASGVTIDVNDNDTCMGVLENVGGKVRYVFAPPQRTAGRTCIIGLTATEPGGDTANQNALVRIGSRSIPPSDIPVAGEVSAKLITDPQTGTWGPDALGGEGDYLIVNNNAAFIIEGIGSRNTYWYYDGILIDAVALQNGEQIGPEQFEELPVIVGQTAPAIALRGFRGESIEIIDDGSSGTEARIRVHGSDDPFWLVELELIDMLGTGRSNKMNFDYYVDYVLKPDSNVLEMELNVHNPFPIPFSVMAGLAAFTGDSTDLRYPGDAFSLMPLAPISGHQNVPWIAARSNFGDGAVALGLIDDTPMTAYISGVQAVLGLNVLVSPPVLSPNDNLPGGTDEFSFRYYVAVGGSDANSAIAPLIDINPTPIPGTTVTANTISGTAFNATTALPLPNAEVELQRNSDKNPAWMFLNSYLSNASGNFSGVFPELESANTIYSYRVVAHAQGFQDSTPFAVTPAAATGLTVNVSPAGSLAYTVQDSLGNSLPSKIILWETGTSNMKQRIYTSTGFGSEPVLPGNYDVSVTRGFEYEIYTSNIDIVGGAATNLDVTINRVINTTGYMSVDTHIHAGPSADNTVITVAARIASAAGEGLEIAVSTDHEYVGSWHYGVEDLNLYDWVNTVTGFENTASTPGHMNLYPITPMYQVDARGGMTRWWEPNGNDRAPYSMDVEEMLASHRVRGPNAISQINHPRDTGATYYSDYLPAQGYSARMPADIGLAPTGRLLRWYSDFDAIEIMNGNDDIFYNAAAVNPKKTGMYEDWMSFHNFGNRITGVGVSDAHDYNEPPGYPRNYFVSSTDNPYDFDQDEFVDSVKNQRVLVSTGAFARVSVIDPVAGTTLANLGDTVTDTDGTVRLKIHIEALPEIDVQYFKIYVNCDQALRVDATTPDEIVKYDGWVDVTIPLGTDANVVVMGFGNNPIPKGLMIFDPAGVARFVSNPIYVDTDSTSAYDVFPLGKTCTYTKL